MTPADRARMLAYLAGGEDAQIGLQEQRPLGRRVLRPGGEQIARGLFGQDITRYQAPSASPLLPQWATQANRRGLVAENPSGWGEGMIPPRPTGPGGIFGSVMNTPLRMSVTQSQALLPPIEPPMALDTPAPAMAPQRFAVVTANGEEQPLRALPANGGTFKPWMQSAPETAPEPDPWTQALMTVRARQRRGQPDKTVGAFIRHRRGLER